MPCFTTRYISYTSIVMGWYEVSVVRSSKSLQIKFVSAWSGHLEVLRKEIFYELWVN